MTGKAPTWKDYTREELHALMARDYDFGDAEYNELEKANPDHHEEDFEAGREAAKTAARDSNPMDAGTPRWTSWDRGWEAGHVSEMDCAAMREGAAAARAGNPHWINPYIGINAELLEWWHRSHREAARKRAIERESGYQSGVIDRLTGRGERETQNHNEYYTESARGWDDADRGGEEWIDANWEIVRVMLLDEGETCAMAEDAPPEDGSGPHSKPFADLGGRILEAVREGYHRFHGGEAAYNSGSLDGNPHAEGTDEWTWWRLGFLFMEGSCARFAAEDPEDPAGRGLDGNPHGGGDGIEWERGWVHEDGILTVCNLPPEIERAKRLLEEEFGVIGISEEKAE